MTFPESSAPSAQTLTSSATSASSSANTLTRSTIRSVTQRNDPKALAMGLGVYIVWGFFPLYFHMLSPAGAVEVIAHRAFWGLAWCLLALGVIRRFDALKQAFADRQIFKRLALAGFLVVINWSTYVYAIQSGHTVDAAIGYFINPLVTVALGLFVLREQISLLQKVALSLGALAVLILVVGQGRVPWLSLTLAFSFGFYSLVKKDVATKVNPLAGMVVETGTVTPFLMVYYAYLVATKSTSFHALASAGENAPISPWAHLPLLIGAGLLTVIPLIMFAMAARGVTLGTLGFIQYVSPGLQMAVGIIAFGERVEPARWLATGVVWLALLVLSADVIATSRRSRKQMRKVREQITGMPDAD